MEQATEQATSDNVADSDDDFSSEYFRFSPSLDILPTIWEEEQAPGVDQIETDDFSPSSPPNFLSSQLTLQNPGSNFVPTNAPLEPPVQVDRPRGLTSVNWKHFYLHVRNFFRKRGILLGLLFLVNRYFFGCHFRAMTSECTLETDSQKPNDHLFNLLRKGSLRVPTFYSYTMISRHRVVFAICVSLLFGPSIPLLGIMNFPLLRRDGCGEYRPLSYQWHPS